MATLLAGVDDEVVVHQEGQVVDSVAVDIAVGEGVGLAVYKEAGSNTVRVSSS